LFCLFERNGAWTDEGETASIVMPLFAHPYAPLRKSRPAASLLAVVPDYGQKQDIRFGGDDPDAPDC